MNAKEHISPEDLALESLRTLPEAESAAVRAHLAKCAECRAQVAEFSGDVAMIGVSVPQHPLPVGARQRFLDRVAEDAYAAKPVASEIPEKPATVVASPIWSLISWAIVAGLAIFAYMLNAKIGALNRQLQDEQSKVAQLNAENAESAKSKRVLDVLMSQSAQRVVLTAYRTYPQPTGRATYIAESGSLLFQANNLRQIAAEKTYELWVIPVNGKPIPAGLFRPDASGNASVLLPTIPSGVAAKAFGVTLEKADGSDMPTAPILMSSAPPAPAGE
jgi:hypothetical protein